MKRKSNEKTFLPLFTRTHTPHTHIHVKGDNSDDDSHDNEIGETFNKIADRICVDVNVLDGGFVVG